MDYSYLALFSEYDIARGICGWYYAYDIHTKTNSGFAPKFCDD